VAILDISSAQRLVTALINCSDVAFSFYKEIAASENIGYEEAKQKIKKEVTEYIGRDFKIQRLGNCSLSFSNYISNDGNLLKVTLYLLRRYSPCGADNRRRLEHAIHQI